MRIHMYCAYRILHILRKFRRWYPLFAGIRLSTRCNTLQHTATHCNTLEPTHWNSFESNESIGAGIRCSIDSFDS